MATVNDDAKGLYEKRYGAKGMPPEIAFLRRYAPTYDDARQALLATVYTPAQPALAVKHREMVAASIIAVRGFSSVEHHLRRALKEGATMRELVEAMTVAALQGGFRTLIFGVGYLVKLADELGIEPDERDGDGMQADSGETLDERLGYSTAEYDWLRDYSPEFEAARRDLLSFILAPTENAALPTRYRELITAAILAFRGDANVGQHLRRALREGASIGEVIEAMQVAGVPGGAPTLHLALTHLRVIADEMGITPDGRSGNAVRG